MAKTQEELIQLKKEHDQSNLIIIILIIQFNNYIYNFCKANNLTSKDFLLHFHAVNEQGEEVKFNSAIDSLANGETKYKLEITITDAFKHSSTKTKSITIDNTPPVVVITRPNTQADDTGYDSYGQEFIVTGYIGDTCDKKDITVEVYRNEADVNNSEPVLTFTKTDINSTDFSITVASKNPDASNFTKEEIEMIDESYSTIEADEKLKTTGLSYEKRKEIIDEMAAVVILERYISKHFQ